MLLKFTFFWLKITIDFILSIAVHLLPSSSDWSSEFLYDVKMGSPDRPESEDFFFSDQCSIPKDP